MTDADRQFCAEARICAMTMPASAQQVIKELLEVIDRLEHRREINLDYSVYEKTRD